MITHISLQTDSGPSAPGPGLSANLAAAAQPIYRSDLSLQRSLRSQPQPIPDIDLNQPL